MHPPTLFTKQTFKPLLQVCSSCPNQLKQIHAIVLSTGLSIKNSLITQLLTCFTILGDMPYARQLFDEMHKPRTFLWNTLIKGYVKNELPCEAASVYRQMHSLGISPDPFTYPFVVKACSGLGETWEGEAIHGHVVKYGLEFVAMVRTELMIMYVKFGELGLADFLFESMVERDLVAWNALIAACVQMGYAGKALSLFRQIGVDGIQPDAVSVVSALSGCGQLGCLEIGEEIYRLARKEGIDCNIIVENAHLDMYVKCGSVEMARDLFEIIPCRNVVSWSTMIAGYAMNGESEKALALFSRMQSEGLKPNYVTYLGVLSACSHSGLVSQGRAYFNRMAHSGDKNIQPRKEHYACMVDLLGRSGHLDEAFNFIKSMPMEPDSGVWGALLGACVIHQNLELAQHVADNLFEVAPAIASYHVLLSNVYATAGRWDCVDKVRLRMRKKGIKKITAYSSVESDGEIHVFFGGDRSHPQSASIYDKLEELLKQMKCIGYIPKTGYVLHDVEMEDKEVTLSTHSEKLGIVFGLINVKPEYPIRVMKNLRVCEDCHTFSKFISKITGRNIIMRDKKRFHHFRNGVCSCKDFW
ncbi:PPR domain-containing protein/PPR_2 domain-containing protein/DYW_deaminase domain-containing protein [Cephalotus follicularis]|uniref:PPR domain-containing protein/PPR_2 domain-containing protein/DYW_deaminase domain-containing protein n=1 Tax=Cephalotus follicularis TaxID=3775 RepID=A0A1Q3B5B3_CEPFO|nr:PPR domain-containing protein/PPR_2 domain-containing protein/DYW_deaminase domain-containing protein [Cephalotus follicularis]